MSRKNFKKLNANGVVECMVGHWRRFGSDQSVWRDGDWNGFVRIALAGLLDVRNCRVEI